MKTDPQLAASADIHEGNHVCEVRPARSGLQPPSQHGPGMSPFSHDRTKDRPMPASPPVLPTSVSPDCVSLPYGVSDLNPQVERINDAPRTVRCYVRGCRHVLRTPTRNSPGEVCPDHGIRCHHSFSGSTYAYQDVRRNIIASQELFAQRIVGHPFKYESHRLGLEKSEDALSWNVFRSLQEAGRLGRLAAAITSREDPDEPYLFLWGICTTNDSCQPWELLVQARERFESHLPVKRPKTEPDIALYLPGRYLILIEAKFTSPNTFYEHGPRRDRQSLTLAELLTIFHEPGLRLLDHRRAATARRVAFQLWRNTVFAEWMSRRDGPNTRAYHVNLVRSGYEQESASEFSELISDGCEDRFRRMTWEQIFEITRDEPALTRMRAYLENKTAGLTKALRV